MSVDEPERNASTPMRPSHVEPSWFVKAFSLIGAIIAVSAVAALVTLLTYALISVKRWDRAPYSTFGIAWGITARLFADSVRRGIKSTLANPSLTEKKRVMLGEQLAMLHATRWFVRIELIGSVVLLIVELLMRR